MGSWDDDFVFSDGATHGEAKFAPVCPSQTSGTIEDWDLDSMIVGKDIASTSEVVCHGVQDLSLAEAEDPEWDDTYELRSCASSASLFSYNETKSKQRFESLLEYIDGHHANAGEATTIAEAQGLPRPPLLFSSNRRLSAQGNKEMHTAQMKYDDLKTRQSNPNNAIESTKNPAILLRDPIWRQQGSTPGPWLTPHAPESPQGVVAWLMNLSAKVRNTRAVVARPSPKLVSKRECDRCPSDELALERHLRLTEMAYCSAAVDNDLLNATRMLKSLLRRLDEVRSADIGHPRSSALLSLEVGCGLATVDDIEVRSTQCAARLIRLTCRLVQRCGESKAMLNESINAVDIAILRRCAYAIANDNQDEMERRLRVLLFIFEGMAHLALLHGRATRPPDSCTTTFRCWCASLPPLPRASFAHVISALRESCVRGVCVDELQATAMADLLLDAMGYSPLTCEQLLSETELNDVFFDEDKPILAGSRRGRYVLGGALLVMSPRELGCRLSTFVRNLPATSLARAKAALALGIFHLRGAERLADVTMYAAHDSCNKTQCGTTSLIVTKGSSTSVPSAKFQNRRDAAANVHLQPQHVTAHQSPSQSKHQWHRLTHHAAEAELRVSEMLLFEAACVIEQHATTEPLDLPFYACQYGADLLSSTCAARDKAATSYSALACSMGFTALRALARSLDRRSKHAYAALALEVCIEILELRDERFERRRLQRELAIVSARLGDCDLSRYFLRVLADVNDRVDARISWFSSAHHANASDSDIGFLQTAEMRRVARVGDNECQTRVKSCTKKSPPPLRILARRQKIWLCKATRRISAASAAKMPLISMSVGLPKALEIEHDIHCLNDIHETTKATELAVSGQSIKCIGDSGDLAILVEQIRRLETSVSFVQPLSAPGLELEATLDRTSLGLARIALSNANPGNAVRLLSKSLTSGRPSSIMRRIALLSWVAKARLSIRDAPGCGVVLARIRRLRNVSRLRHCRLHSSLLVPLVRRSVCTTAPICSGQNKPYELRLQSALVADGTCVLTSRMNSCLLRHCSPRYDIGELSALRYLASNNPIAALHGLAPTIAAVEGVVSRAGTPEGLAELGRLYHLRGVVQESVSLSVHTKSTFPIRLHHSAVCNPSQMVASVAAGGYKEVKRVEQARFFKAEESGVNETIPDSGLLATAIELAKVFNTSSCLRSQILANITGASNSPYPPLTAAESAYPVLLRKTRTAPLSFSKAVKKNASTIESISQTAYASAGWQLKFYRRSMSKRKSGALRDFAAQRQARRRHHWSRHYRAYLDSDEVALDALRWFRLALQCFKARNDDIGICTAASSFARLQLERVIAPVAFDRVSLAAAEESLLVSERSWGVQTNKKSIFDDVDAAARCALSRAALACDPILLLGAYLTVAEVHLIRRARLAAIAHWWEARDLFLRFFVAGKSIPMLRLFSGERYLVETIRGFLERMIRFLVACDRAMINENVLLLDIFITFERDARALVIHDFGEHSCSPIPLAARAGGVRNVNFTLHGNEHSFSQEPRSCGESHTNILMCAPPSGVDRNVIGAWECIVLVRNQVAVHRVRTPFSTMSDLRDRNRAALCLLNEKMRCLRKMENPHYLSGKIQISQPQENLVYAVHVASTLVMYCPRTGVRHVAACGRGARRLALNLNLRNSISTGSSSSSLALRQEWNARANASSSTQAGLSPQAAVFVAALAAHSNKAITGKLGFFEECDICGGAAQVLHQPTHSDNPVYADIVFRKRAISALISDLELAHNAFLSLISGVPTKENFRLPQVRRERRPIFVHLICSERAQLIPWECLAGKDVSLFRMRCTGDIPFLDREGSLRSSITEAKGGCANRRRHPFSCDMPLCGERERKHIVEKRRAPGIIIESGSSVTFHSALSEGHRGGAIVDELASGVIAGHVFELCSHDTLALVMLAARNCIGMNGTYELKSTVRSPSKVLQICSRVGSTLSHTLCRGCPSLATQRHFNLASIKFSKASHGSTKTMSATDILVLESSRLHLPRNSLAPVHTVDQIAMLYVPKPCLALVRAEACAFLHETCDLEVKSHEVQHDTICQEHSSFPSHKNTLELVATFACEMTQKYSLPVVAGYSLAS